MENAKPIILAINPGTRYMGTAVLQGHDLIDWGVKILEGKWSPDKLAKALAVVSALISDYHPNVLVMKTPHPSRTSDHLNDLCRQIAALAKKQGMDVQQYGVEDIKD